MHIRGRIKNKTIQKIKLGKAPGHGEITGEMTKFLNKEAKQELSSFLNQAKREKTPEDWRIGIITPIYKKGYSKNYGNCKGITLTSIVGKIYARILETRLREKVEEQLEEI